MIFLAFVYPIFTLPYLRLYYFPWVVPLPIIAEVVVFILLDPDLSKMRLALMILGANFLGLLIGFMVAYAGQWALQMVFGNELLARATPLSYLGLILALLVSGVVKCIIWSLVFGPNPYLRRVVMVTHLICFLVLCASFYALPYLGSLQVPDFSQFNFFSNGT